MTPATIAGMAKIIGLDLIALTDHNSCKNCPAIQKAANAYGILFLPGMELTTAEEVHVLCYFPQLTAAMNFDSYVSSHLPHIPNKPALFGEQRICDEEDQILGQENRLLISATDIPFSSVYDLSCAEIKNDADWPLLQQQFPYLQHCNHLCSSDAHDLNAIHEPIYTLQTTGTTPEDLLTAIQTRI